MLEERVRLTSERLGRISAAGRFRDAALAPWLPVAAIVGIVFAVTAIWVRAVHSFSVMPDELGYVKQSLEIANTGFLVGPHYFWFDSLGELLPLISAPIFGGLGMVDAFYAAHTLYAFLLASTAIPAYLLARELRLGSLAAYLVAALSVVIPWLVLSGLVMTEIVAYPAFAWAFLAMLRAIDAPSARRDLLAILAILVATFARTQFLVLGPILIVAVLAHEGLMALAARGQGSVTKAVRTGLRSALDRHGVLCMATGLALLGYVAGSTSGSVDSALGGYSGFVHGQLLPSGTFSAGIEQLGGVVLAIGVVPLTLSATWSLATLGRSRDPARHAYAVLLVVAVPVLVAVVGSFAERFLGGSTTDRYLFYLVPVLFTGGAAWVVDRRGSLLGTVAAGAAVAWIVITTSLHYTPVVTITNPGYGIHRVFINEGRRLLPSVDPRVVIAIIVSVFTLLLVLARDRLRTWKALLVFALPLLAYGAFATAYDMTQLNTLFSSLPASHPESLTWIDRLVPHNARVGLVVAPYGLAAQDDPLDTWWTWWQPAFWNKTVQREYVLPGGDVFGQIAGGMNQDLVHGRLDGVDAVNYLVKLSGDTRFEPRGRLLTPAPDATYLVYRIPAGAPLAYGTQGVDQYSRLSPSSGSFLRVFGSGAAPVRERVVLDFETIAAQADCPCRLRLGSHYGQVSLPAATSTLQPHVRVTRTVTVPPDGYGQLNLDVRGTHGFLAGPWILLDSVQITPLPRP